MSKEQRAEVRYKKLDYLFRNLGSSLWALTFISSIVYLTFRDHVDETALNIWYFLIITVVLFRATVLRSYNRDDQGIVLYKKYYTLYATGLYLSGFLWGVTVFTILPESNEYQMFLLMMVGGLASGAAVTTSSKIELFYGYLLLSLLPFLYFLFILIDSDTAKELGAAVSIYMFIMAVIARRISISVHNNIELAIQNRELLKQQEQKIIEVKSANEAKSKFLSFMSHEIRTPLNAIIGFIKLLKKDEKDSVKIKYLDTIDKSSYVLLHVLNDILDITKIESGKFTIEKVDFNPKEEFGAVYELFEQVSTEKGVKLVNSISEELPENIRCDKLRLEQIVSNLLSNAVKFTPKGKCVELIVEFDEKSSSLHIEVKDEGVGIAQENIEKILEDFTQADSSISRKYGGTGLGLSISKKLLEMLGSRLHVKSKLGHGSSFSFDISADVITKKHTYESETAEADFSGKKVLVAEDNKTNQMLIEILLNDMNIQVSMANDGQEAVDLCREGDFDIVLMDINMPNKNGIEAMHDIKECESGLGLNKSIIALTANSVSGDREKYIDEGFDDYIAKPIENDELIKVLQKYFS